MCSRGGCPRNQHIPPAEEVGTPGEEDTSGLRTKARFPLQQVLLPGSIGERQPTRGKSREYCQKMGRSSQKSQAKSFGKEVINSVRLSETLFQDLAGQGLTHNAWSRIGTHRC